MIFSSACLPKSPHIVSIVDKMVTTFVWKKVDLIFPTIKSLKSLNKTEVLIGAANTLQAYLSGAPPKSTGFDSPWGPVVCNISSARGRNIL